MTCADTKWGNLLEMRLVILKIRLRDGFLLNATGAAAPLNQLCFQRLKERNEWKHISEEMNENKSLRKWMKINLWKNKGKQNLWKVILLLYATTVDCTWSAYPFEACLNVYVASCGDIIQDVTEMNGLSCWRTIQN